MLSVIIPALNAETSLARTLAALVPAAVEGLVKDVVVVDGGSSDATRRIANEAGARLITSEQGRGTQLAAGPPAARGTWFLFLHADTTLGEGWADEAHRFIARAQSGDCREQAAVFRFVLDDEGVRPRLLERLVGWRCRLFGLPYGDQGLLISRQQYEAIGGFRAIPLMEDVDIVRRLGRRRIRFLNAPAVTSAGRYRREGYVRRPLRNACCLALYLLRVPPHVLVRLYG